MQVNYKNLCVRCGTERVVTKISKEKVFGSIVITTETKCPNPACQKIVNRDNKKALDKFLMHRARSEERAKVRKRGRVSKE